MSARPHTARRLLALFVAAGIWEVHGVRAQEAGGFELEEIVVTARKREENLQEVPLAVSAFSGESIAKRGILNLADFNEAVPGIEVQAGNGVAGVANIYIRGVGQRNTEPNLDSGVGIYLDGIYISRADGALLDMNDVSSVQVLRGPQGTLFGKNTTGGALLIETNRPTQELEGKLSVTVGNYDQINAAGVLNVPLIDGVLATRLSLMSIERDGYIDNPTVGDEYNDEDRQSAIWQLRFTPTEDLTADLNVNWSETDQKPRGLQCHPSSVNFGQGWQSQLQNSLVMAAYGRSIESFCLDSANTDRETTLQDLGGGYYAENTGASVTLNWKFADSMSLKSITGWRRTVAGQNDDLEPLSIPFLHRSNDALPFAKDRDTEQWSQEFDFSGSAFDGFVSWVAGAYYFSEETDQSRTVGITGPFKVFSLGATDVDFYNANATDLWTDNESWALFAQQDWALAERWTLTTGLRYTSETRELTRNTYLPDISTLSTAGPGRAVQFQPSVYFIPAGTFNPLHGFVLNEVDQDDVDADAWTPTLSLRYLIEDAGFIESGSVYVTYSKGFRSGGLSEAPSPDLEEFDPEEVNSIELGFKFDAWDKRVRMNAALFALDYDDRQLTSIVVSPEGRIAGATVNAAKSSVTGFELEGTVLPTDNFEISLNAAWYDDEIEEWADTQLQINKAGLVPGGSSIAPNDVTPAPSASNCEIATHPTSAENVGTVEQCIIDRSDENLPRLPSKSLMLAVQYYLDTPIGTVVPRLQYSKKWDIDSCFDRLSCVSGDFLNDHEDLSARLSWTSTDAAWTLAAYVDNITEEDYVIGGQPLYDPLGFGGFVYAPPRMYGAELSYRF